MQMNKTGVEFLSLSPWTKVEELETNSHRGNFSGPCFFLKKKNFSGPCLLKKKKKSTTPHSLWKPTSLMRDWTCFLCIGRWNLNHWTTWKTPGTYLFPLWALSTQGLFVGYTHQPKASSRHFQGDGKSWILKPQWTRSSPEEWLHHGGGTPWRHPKWFPIPEQKSSTPKRRITILTSQQLFGGQINQRRG